MQTTAENFCIRWNDFETNISTSFKDFRRPSNKYFDIFLTCDDSRGVFIKAHKFVLMASSNFFKSLVNSYYSDVHDNITPSLLNSIPILYLRGVRSADLECILDFMYLGEANVGQEDLGSFLAVAEDLEIKGLSLASTKQRSSSNITTTTEMVRDHLKRKKYADSSTSLKRLKDSQSVTLTSGEKLGQGQQSELHDIVHGVFSVGNSHETQTSYLVNDATATLNSKKDTVEVDTHEYQWMTEVELGGGGGGTDDLSTDKAVQKTEEMIASSTQDFTNLIQSLMTSESGTHTCNLCGKKSPWRTTMVRHIEANHVESGGHICDVCGIVSKTKHAYAMHRRRRHPHLFSGQGTSGLSLVASNDSITSGFRPLTDQQQQQVVTTTLPAILCSSSNRATGGVGGGSIVGVHPSILAPSGLSSTGVSRSKLGISPAVVGVRQHQGGGNNNGQSGIGGGRTIQLFYGGGSEGGSQVSSVGHHEEQQRREVSEIDLVVTEDGQATETFQTILVHTPSNGDGVV